MKFIKILSSACTLACLILLNAAFAQTDGNGQTKKIIFQLENNALVLPSAIKFKPDTDELLPESIPALEYAAAYLKEKNYISLMRIEGHLSDMSGEEEMLNLSQKRALAVANWLITHGIDCNRLIAVGFANKKPIVNNSASDEKNQNERISFVNAGLRGRPIGGMPIDGGGAVAKIPCR